MSWKDESNTQIAKAHMMDALAGRPDVITTPFPLVSCTAVFGFPSISTKNPQGRQSKIRHPLDAPPSDLDPLRATTCTLTKPDGMQLHD